jgi:hypothetical protein
LGSGEQVAASSTDDMSSPANKTSACDKVTQSVNHVDISVYRPVSLGNNADSGLPSFPSSTIVTLCVPGFGGTIERSAPMDIVFAIDSSSSMTQNNPSNLRLEAAKQFVDSLNSSQDQAGIVSCSRAVDFSFGLTRDLGKLAAAIDLVDSSGGTNLDAGLADAIQMLDNSNRTRGSLDNSESQEFQR